MICPKCSYERTASDDETTPGWKCPRCEIAYAKYKATPAPAGAANKDSGGYSAADELRSIVAGVKACFVPEEEKESSFAVGMGIASIIIGCFGLMGSLVPVFGVIGLPVAGLGFFIALIGRIAAINTTSTGMPNAGLVLCALPFLWQLLFVGMII